MDRKATKRRARERKRSIRKEIIRNNPFLKKDPSKLYIEIARLRELEIKGKLDGPGRMKRKHLEEQFISLNKERAKTGLPTMSLPDFDPNAVAQEEEVIPEEVKPVTTVSYEETTKSQQVYGNRNCEHIPMPSDADPGLNHGLPELPPYLNFRL